MNQTESIQFLCNGTKEERAKAAAYLGGCGTEGIETATPLLSNNDWHLRYRACEILGFTENSTVIPLILPLLHDEKDHVRYMAVKSLGKCGGNNQKEIIPLLEDENHFVRRIAQEVLNSKQ